VGPIAESAWGSLTGFEKGKIDHGVTYEQRSLARYPTAYRGHTYPKAVSKSIYYELANTRMEKRLAEVGCVGGDTLRTCVWCLDTEDFQDQR